VRLVETHNKYSGAGLVILSVHLDKPGTREEARRKAEKNALEFLKRNKAGYTNLILDEPYESWEKKLKEPGTPIIYLFDRQNRTVGKYTDAEEAEAGFKKWLPKLLAK
jgi:hypothetical protein